MNQRISLFVAAASGFIALSYEILWYRLYSYVSSGAPSAFGSLLGFYLLGIAAGSFASRAYCKDHASAGDMKQLRVLAGFLFLANVVGFVVAPALGVIVTHTHWFFGLFAVGVATTLLGAVLPLLAHFGIAPDAKTGANLSYLYLANIVGSSAGSLLTGFVAMEYLTTREIGVLIAVLGFVLVLSLIVASGARGVRLGAEGIVVVAAAVVVGFSSYPLFDQLYERLLFKGRFTPDMHFPEIVENRSGVVNTTADGRIWGGGAYDGAFNTTLVRDKNWVIRAYAVSAMHPAPKRILMIGLASGSWGQVLANAPALESLTVVEINPGYLQIIARHPEVASLLSNPKVHIVIDDGRRWLLSHPGEMFDAIVANTTWNWRAHSTNLLSSEFLQIGRAHMRPGGIIFYNATSSRDVYKTAVTVFPYALRVMSFVAVSDSPFALDKTRWKQVLQDYRVDGRPVFDLAVGTDKSAYDQAVALADTVDTPCAGPDPDNDCWASLEGRDSLIERTADAEVITDDNMVTEWQNAFPEGEP